MPLPISLSCIFNRSENTPNLPLADTRFAFITVFLSCCSTTSRFFSGYCLWNVHIFVGEKILDCSKTAFTDLTQTPAAIQWCPYRQQQRCSETLPASTSAFKGPNVWLRLNDFRRRLFCIASFMHGNLSSLLLEFPQITFGGHGLASTWLVPNRSVV